MRNNFWKWLKRFFIILPVIMILLQIVFFMGSFWRDNGESDFSLGDDDFIQVIVNQGSWQGNGISNPLIYEPNTTYGIYGTINDSFYSIVGLMNGSSGNSYIQDVIQEPHNYPYEIIIVNFLTWWVFVELIFLFFRFITFLISWVNSLFDNTFKKINK